MKAIAMDMESVAAIFGIAGAMLLATAVHPGLGFASFLGSNLAGLAFMGRCGHWRTVAKEAVFLVSSVVGLWNWWLGPLVLG